MYIIMSLRNFSKRLAIALNYSRSNPQYLEINCVLFSRTIFNIHSCTQRRNESKLTPVCLLLNPPSLIYFDKIRVP